MNDLFLGDTELSDASSEILHIHVDRRVCTNGLRAAENGPQLPPEQDYFISVHLG